MSLPRALAALVAVLALSMILWPETVRLTRQQAPAAALILLAIGCWATGVLPFHLTRLLLVALARLFRLIHCGC